VQEFTFSKYWIRPANKKITFVVVLGAGAGAGSGRRGATSTNAAGGLGGAPGCSVQGWFLTQSLGATEWVTIGIGGTGGAAVTTDGTSGNPGTAGQGSIFATLRAMGGTAGFGGTTAAGSVAAGIVNSGGIYSYIATSMTGSLNSISGASQQLSVAMSTSSQYAGPTAGGSGGSISSSNVAYAGAKSGQFTGNVPYFTTWPAGGGNTGVAGQSGNGDAYSHMNGGIGGSGGGANLTGPGGNGGNGHRGGGGGGGGASRNGNNSGKGGDGGNGYAVAISF
jgi:hypothetical protein